MPDQQEPVCQEPGCGRPACGCGDVRFGLDLLYQTLKQRPDLAPAVEPPIRGVADGVAGWISRSDQLHILGNGVVPQQAALAYRTLHEAMSGAINAV